MGLFSAGRASLRHTPLQRKVIASITFLCLVLVGLNGWRTWRERQVQIAEDQVATANLAKSLSQHTYDLIEAADMAIVGLRDIIEVEGLKPAVVKHLDRLMSAQIAALPILHSLTVLDAVGTYTSTSTPTMANALNGSDRAYFQYHRSHPDRGTHVGSPVQGKITGKWAITVSRRLNAPDGSFAGVAVAMLSADSFQHFYETFDTGAHGVITLTSDDGILIARKSDNNFQPGTNISASLKGAQVLPLLSHANFKYVAVVDGVTRLGSYQRVEGSPLVVFVAHGFDEVLADWYSDAVFHSLATVGTAVVFLWLGIRFASQIRKRQQAAITVRQSERHYRLLADNSTDLITQLGPDLKRLYVSPASKTMLGYDPRELIGRSASDLLRAEDEAAFSESLTKAIRDGEAPPTRHRARRKDGSEIWVETTGRRMADGQGFVITTRDITLRKAAEDQLHEANGQLQRLALLDGLTGISNRRGFDLALEREHRRATREDTELVLLLIDVDHFKAFNDTHGHQAGDACLQAIATCLSQQMQRPADLSARYGGEEFAMLLPGTGLDGALLLAERVLAAVRDLSIARRSEEAEVVTVSVGAAVIRPRRDEHSLGDLIRLADAALYRAKDGGRNRVCCADAEPDVAAPVVTASVTAS